MTDSPASSLFSMDDTVYLKPGTKLSMNTMVDRGDMKMTIGRHFGQPCTLKRLENICVDHPLLPWRIRLDGVWYERIAEGSWREEKE